jgi:hypothetical protein
MVSKSKNETEKENERRLNTIGYIDTTAVRNNSRQFISSGDTLRFIESRVFIPYFAKTK